MTDPYQQPERYCLMQYHCGACGYLERIWNSRNAVTPFTVGCGQPDCDGLMEHVNWRADTRWHRLPPEAGRVFVSITRDDARRLAERKWETYVTRADLPDPPEPKAATLEAWAEHLYGDGSQPYTVTRTEYRNRQGKEG